MRSSLGNCGGDGVVLRPRCWRPCPRWPTPPPPPPVTVRSRPVARNKRAPRRLRQLLAAPRTRTGGTKTRPVMRPLTPLSHQWGRTGMSRSTQDPCRTDEDQGASTDLAAWAADGAPWRSDAARPVDLGRGSRTLLSGGDPRPPGADLDRAVAPSDAALASSPATGTRRERRAAADLQRPRRRRCRRPSRPALCRLPRRPGARRYDPSSAVPRSPRFDLRVYHTMGRGPGAFLLCLDGPEGVPTSSCRARCSATSAPPGSAAGDVEAAVGFAGRPFHFTAGSATGAISARAGHRLDSRCCDMRRLTPAAEVHLERALESMACARPPRGLC